MEAVSFNNQSGANEKITHAPKPWSDFSEFPKWSSVNCYTDFYQGFIAFYQDDWRDLWSNNNSIKSSYYKDCGSKAWVISMIEFFCTDSTYSKKQTNLFITI